MSNPSKKPLHAEEGVRYATVHDWVQQEAISFSFNGSDSLKVAVDQVIAVCGDRVQLLGLGEPLHGGEAFFTLRNRLFQHLVEAHGYSAIAVESSFPKSRIVNDYITGRGADTFDTVLNTGFSHGFGAFEANRELVEWMRVYNADPSHTPKIHFYGFDSPTEMYGTDSPHDVLNFVLDYLASVNAPLGQHYRDRIEPLLGEAAVWENPAAIMDPSQGIGLSPEAGQLRLETEELITDLHIRRLEWVAESSKDRYLEAVQFASVARQLLTYHAALARSSDDRFVRLMGIRDAMMADMLIKIVARERDSGKVLAFAHNSHLKRGRGEWQLGANLHTWNPAGAHLGAMFGADYVVIGTALGVSEANGVGAPEPGTLEAILMEHSGPARFVQTHYGERLPPSLIAEMPTRTASPKNGSYFPLTAQSFTDFDWFCFLDSTTYSRGAPPLPA